MEEDENNGSNISDRPGNRNEMMSISDDVRPLRASVTVGRRRANREEGEGLAEGDDDEEEIEAVLREIREAEGIEDEEEETDEDVMEALSLIPMSESDNEAPNPSQASDLSISARGSNQFNAHRRDRNVTLESARGAPAVTPSSTSTISRGDPNYQELLRARQRTEAVNVSMAMASSASPQSYTTGNPVATAMASTSGLRHATIAGEAMATESNIEQQGPINYSTDNNGGGGGGSASSSQVSRHLTYHSTPAYINHATSSSTTNSTGVSHTTNSNREHCHEATRHPGGVVSLPSGDIPKSAPGFVAANLSKYARRDVGALINAECCAGDNTPELDSIMDTLFNPEKDIDNPENIEWVQWLLAGGRSPAEFVKIVRSYDNHAKCGLVWVPHVVAYRCRTCGISPCMSICRDCFKKGDHSNHDFNMFLSQAGGACDCGDTSVMKAEGFCSDHGINNRINKDPVPPDLLAVAEAIMPKLLFRLLQHFWRDCDPISQNYTFESHLCEEFTNMLIELNNMGEIMRRVMTGALINKDIYAKLINTIMFNTRHSKVLKMYRKNYEEAVNRFPRSEPPDDYKHLPALGEKLSHQSLLDEFIFWTFKFEFPQNLVCFLLNMLPDQDYKEHLTRTFVMHYSRIPSVLEMSRDPDTLSNRVVHMSVQLFSNESLALKMVNELSLLHVMIISLKLMMSKILVKNTLHDPSKNFHFVIDCTRKVMKDHCYWPLVSDFNNVLSHESVALVFLRDDNLIDMWFQFLSMLQGMNVNVRETASHVEFEPNSYYAAFSCELEASAYPMWSIITHLQDGKHAHLAKKIISYCVNTLHEWLDDIYYQEPKISQEEMLQASFHFPLHRYLAAFVCQAVTKMGMSLTDVLPTRSYILPLLMMHPLRVQGFFYEILAGIWVRNGLQIKGQAMTYIQANFCNSMADMDLFFLQICATNIPQSFFLQNTIDIFGIGSWLELAPMCQPQKLEQTSMLEGFLTFLATLVTSRTNLGNDESTQCIIEISALLATENKTHSQLLELMPERSGNVHTKNFEMFLKKLSIYKAPSSGTENLEQGLFTPIDEVWEEYYDPLHVLLRAVHRRDFQASLDRFMAYVKAKDKMPASGNLWPPFRLPRAVGGAFSDPCCILNSKVFHSTILAILFRAVYSRDVSEHLLALTIFLLEIAIESSEDIKAQSNTKAMVVECQEKSNKPCYPFGLRRDPPRLFRCYPTDNLSCNLRHVVPKIQLKSSNSQATPVHYLTRCAYEDMGFDTDGSDSAMDMNPEWDYDEFNRSLSVVRRNSGGTIPTTTAMVPLRLQSMEVAVPADLSVVPETGLVLHQDSEENDNSYTGSTAHAIEGITGNIGTTRGVGRGPAIEARFALAAGMEMVLRERGTTVAILPGEESDNLGDAVSSLNQQQQQSQSQQQQQQQQQSIQQSQSHSASSNQTDNEICSTSRASGNSGGVNSGTLMPYPRLQPISLVPNNNREVVPTNTTAAGHGPLSLRRSFDSVNRKRSMDNAIDEHGKNDMLIDESILSLLLKLHSQLSGTLDSFSLFDETMSDDTRDDEGDVESRRDTGEAGDGRTADYNDKDESMDVALDFSKDAQPMDCCLSEGETPSTSAAAAVNTDHQPQQSRKLGGRKKIQVSESRIGDGPYFIGNLLRKIAQRDELCAQNIEEIRQRLWPNQREKQAEQKAKEAREKEERRKRARERQMKMMQDFANKQKQFMQSATANNLDTGMEDDEEFYEEQPREKEYDCIICNCTTPSTETNPIGLIVLVESSGIVGHRRRTVSRLLLPLCHEDSEHLKQCIRLANVYQKRTELLSAKYGEESWYLSNNMAYENGVHVQSCGHHVHLSCLDAYLKTLYATQRQHLHERGEFYCPVCRQLSNSVLPLSPQLDRPIPMVRRGSQTFQYLANELSNLIRENEKPPTSTKLSEAMGRAMEDMTNITHRKMKRIPPTFRSLFIFVTSIARTNLESEIIQRGGSLCSANSTRYKAKRDCIVPLLHVLSVHVRVLAEWPLWSSWASLAGLPITETAPVPAHCREVIPSLLADPIALLLKFILLAPLHLDLEYFTCMVKVMYNLLYYQIVTQLCVKFSDIECEHIISTYGKPDTLSKNLQPHESLINAMALVLGNTNRLVHLRHDATVPSTSKGKSKSQQQSSGATNAMDLNDGDGQSLSSSVSSVLDTIKFKSMEMQLQTLILPYLRIAALLRQHLYHQDMPEITAPSFEFVRLVYYLELVTDSMEWDSFNAAKGLCFIAGTEESLPRFWCEQLLSIRPPKDGLSELVMINQHVPWQQPKLLQLPREYERLFTYYHERPCLTCYMVPKESSICLLCGTIVCLKQSCCVEKDCCEAVRHTISCGGGIGIFLVVTSTYIIVIRGRRACLWGSLYLDDFDEEDRDLKRGKPLYLSQDRFNLLESQWLSHKFAHTKQNWVFHRDLL